MSRDRELDGPRLDLFRFAAAPERERYVGVLRAFDEARERSQLQIGPDELAAVVHDETPASALALLDQLHVWGVVDRAQDDRRVRTIAEYRQRRSIYTMTELGWMAWDAVQRVLLAQPREAELRRLVLPSVRDALASLARAVRARDAEQVAHHLDEIHRTLDDLAHHATRFLLATSAIATSWEATPTDFVALKDRLISHIQGFLDALAVNRPLLALAVREVEAEGVDTLLELAARGGGALQGTEAARRRAELRWQGVVAWFADDGVEPSKAETLEQRTSRAIRDLTVLLRRVLDASAGGVSRARQLERLAEWFVRCPDDDAASALAGLAFGLQGARHFGPAPDDPEAVASSTSWWQAPPAPVDTTLRKRGRASSPAPPAPLPDQRRERNLLRARQVAARDAERTATRRLEQALALDRALEPAELDLLLTLLGRALRTGHPARGVVRSTHGRIRVELRPADHDTVVRATTGTLLLPGCALTVHDAEHT